jgi:hypothetical protein
VLAVTEYVPEASVLTLPIEGFWLIEVKLFGPLQLYVVPELEAVKLKVCPEQTGELLPATGTAGGGFTVTEVVPAGPVHPFCVTVIE